MEDNTNEKETILSPCKK